jgi:molecular chaperone DnaK
LNVSARDLATGKQQSIEIKGSSGLSQPEIDTMRKDAEAHAEEDHKRRELVDLKNQGDAMAYQMEKMLREQGEKVSSGDRGNIESAISTLKDAVKGDDADAIKRAIQNLERQSHKVAEEMYRSAGAAGKAAPPRAEESPKGRKGGDDVIDAEYEVKE